MRQLTAPEAPRRRRELDRLPTPPPPPREYHPGAVSGRLRCLEPGRPLEPSAVAVDSGSADDRDTRIFDERPSNVRLQFAEVASSPSERMTTPATARFSDFVIYADESGDHSLTSINPNFPVFCLTFCIFPVHTYVTEVVPAVQQLKFDFFGHDQIVLHENEIRRANRRVRISPVGCPPGKIHEQGSRRCSATPMSPSLLP